MGNPWTPGPVKYDSGALYIDRGIQPYVARLEDVPNRDQWGELFAAAPEMAALIERLQNPFRVTDADTAEARALLARIRGDAP